METRPQEDELSRANMGVWSRARPLKDFSTWGLRPVERRLLDDHRADFSGRVLELGCGTGRLTTHLIVVAHSVHGIDVSAAMVDFCRREYPRGTFSECDLRDLSGFEAGAFDAVFAPFNVIDVLSHRERNDTLDEIRRILAPGGLLVMSSHNRNYAPYISGSPRLLARHPRQLANNILHLPRRWRNRRRLRLQEQNHEHYAILNDEAQDFSLLHYYITPEAQTRQLREHLFDPIDCLALDGQYVTPGDPAARCPEIHYVARAMPSASSRTPVERSAA